MISQILFDAIKSSSSIRQFALVVLWLLAAPSASPGCSCFRIFPFNILLEWHALPLVGRPLYRLSPHFVMVSPPQMSFRGLFLDHFI